jgi:hypothetical protein
MEMAFLLHQMGVWVVVWEQAITRRRSKLRGQGHHGLNLYMGHNQTSFLTKNKMASRRQFAKTYGLCNKGLSPKCLKSSKDFEEAEVEKV